MTTAQIPRERLQALFNAAAEFIGLSDARYRSLSPSENFNPSERIGDLVCDAWLIEPILAVEAMARYFDGLRRESAEIGIDVPSDGVILASMQQAISQSAYPAVDVPALLDRLAAASHFEE
ncbi:hypothetical protein [Curtobacterium luteum]|uniref:hypothetical protein n=1 Tax=Curtobacterium luteum TaxID=33881 RepID=UPI003802102B